MADHDDAMALVLESLTSGPTKAIDSLEEIDAVGHRIVQGGKYFDRSVLIDDDVIQKIDELAELAPLHNKAALMGINACLKHMPSTPMVAVFDTSFFQTLPPKLTCTPCPTSCTRSTPIRQVRRPRHLAPLHSPDARGRPVLDGADRGPQAHHVPPGQRLLDIGHRHGVAVDTSMGLTPLDGLMMGTRCGGHRPAIVRS